MIFKLFYYFFLQWCYSVPGPGSSRNIVLQSKRQSLCTYMGKKTVKTTLEEVKCVVMRKNPLGSQSHRAEGRIGSSENLHLTNGIRSFRIMCLAWQVLNVITCVIKECNSSDHGSSDRTVRGLRYIDCKRECMMAENNLSLIRTRKLFWALSWLESENWAVPAQI